MTSTRKTFIQVALYAFLLVAGPFVSSARAEPADIMARGGGAVTSSIVGSDYNSGSDYKGVEAAFTPTNATFGFQVKGYGPLLDIGGGHEKATSSDGNLEFRDHNLGLGIHVGGPGTSIDGVVQFGGCVWIWGTARVQKDVDVGDVSLAKNQTVYFLVDVCDLGEPGTRDTFVITLALSRFFPNNTMDLPGNIFYRAGLSYEGTDEGPDTADAIDRGNIQVAKGNAY